MLTFINENGSEYKMSNISISLSHEHESFESLMRKFKRAVEKDGILQRVRNRERYEKASITRKRMKAAAIKRNQKRFATELSEVHMSVKERKKAAILAEKNNKKKEDESQWDN